eukprot:15211939-Ditylum_brightwellii.AAC.1
MARAKPKTKGKDNKVVDFELFYKQHPFNYSKKEFLAEQGYSDCIHTADCTDADKAECKYRACKATETKLKAQHSNNKHMKSSY